MAPGPWFVVDCAFPAPFYPFGGGKRGVHHSGGRSVCLQARGALHAEGRGERNPEIIALGRSREQFRRDEDEIGGAAGKGVQAGARQGALKSGIVVIRYFSHG